jgi:sugar phosphate isomerase/epimerase
MWNCDLYDLGWLQRRKKVFERFTLPSVQAQSNKNFEWILVSDSRTPDEFKKVLDSYGASVIYHDFENHKWKIPPGDNETRLERSVRLETIGEIIAEHIGKQDTDYVITSRLDNDDCIAFDYIENTQKFSKELWDGTKFWLSLVRGYKWNEDHVYNHNTKWNSFLSFIESPENLETTYQCCHTQAGDSGYPVHIMRRGVPPSWLEVIHGENVMNRRKRVRGKRPAAEEQRRFNFKNE